MMSRYPYQIVPINESPAERDARHAYERAKKRRDDLCDLHLSADRMVDDLRALGFPVIAEAAALVGIMLDNRMQEIGIDDPIEEVVSYIEEFPVCRICALSDANCKCSRDDIDKTSFGIAERG